ncbi:MAG: gliding motility-associated C-terminal domain-containing protein [Bacteroidetes bacterium]|nr:gliding motility-associated C-terminal domain-containing protein [Bacteroidota bacterium]
MKKFLLVIVSIVSLFGSSLAQDITMTSGSSTTYACGGGTFYDPGGTGNYANSLTYTQTICAPAGQYLTFNFTSFNTESCCDRLIIYNGPNTGSPQIGTFAGTNTPGTVTVNPGQCITFSFTSDGSITAAGFTATMSCSTTPPPPPPPVPGACSSAQPFCTATGVTFPAATNTTAPAGPNYGCLLSQPNPQWYYMNIATAGNIQIALSNSAAVDIDFALWGPFPDQASMCGGVTAAPIDCSFSTAATEQVDITAATVGQWYMMLITNFANVPTNISAVAQNAVGTDGSTNCNILCNMTALSATPGACAPATNTYSVTGSMSFVYPPTSGTLTVSSSCGGSVTIPSPWVSPISYTLPGITANGGACSITAAFSADATCQLTQAYTSPAPCNGCTLTAGNNGPVCQGNAFNLTATAVAGATGYSWSGPSAYSSTAQNPTGVGAALAAGTYTYTVVATTAGGTCSSTTTVTVNARPTVTIPAITICNGSSGTLTASGAATYTWTNATGLSATTGTSVTANPTTTTTYTVTGTAANGCTNTGTVTVTVNNPVTPTFAAVPAICSGTALAALPTTSTNGITGTWSPALNNTATTTYTFTPTAGQCATTTTLTITVNPIPSSTFTQSPNQCLTGNTFSFTNTGATGTYSWTFASGTPGTSTTNNPVGVTYAAAGTYTVTHTVTVAGCTSTTTSNVTIFPMPVMAAIPAAAICNGASTSLTAGGANTYAWAPATGLSATSGATVTANPTATTTYTVTGTTANGCTGTTTVTVTVNPLPAISAAPITICAGASGTLTASGASTYSWSPATGLSSTTGASVTANPPATTTYTVTGTSAAGCTGTTTVVVTVNPLPITTVLSPTICPSQTATLTASGASTYSWTAGLSGTTGATVTGSPATTTSYTVTGTTLGCTSTAVATITIGSSIVPTVNSPTICVGQTATLNATNATTYTWTAGLSATTGNSVTGSPASTTSYTVTGTAGGCTGTAVATITVNPLPTITVPAIAICAGTPGTVTASGASTYSWAPSTGLSATTGASVTANPATTTTYTVTGTSAAGCTNTATVVVTVNPLPTIAVAPISICSGVAGSLTASGASTYAWSPATGLSATTGTTVSANPAATSTYTVTGTTAAGCSNTTTVIVTVNPLPTITVPAITVCQGIGGTVTASGANTYTWAPATGLSATTGASPFANPAATTTYTVTGTSALGCTNTATVTVTVSPSASLSTSQVNVSCFGGSNGSATVNPVGGATPYTFAWTPSGGTAATASGLIAGTYTVTVTTANGCTSTTTAIITQPAGMTLTMAAVNATCGAANGQGSVVVTGGTSPYTYAWAPSGGTGSVAGSLTAGSYTVTVTDNNGCTSTNSVAVNNSGSPTANTTVISNVSCFGGNNGSASVTISGGSAPYTQTWSPSGGTGTTATALTAGTYTVTVTDNVGCVVTANATITQPPLLSASTVKTDATCFGGATGTATVTAAGGTSPYNYSWAPSGGTGATASGLVANTYTVTVTDNTGCTSTATAVIAQPTVITSTMSNTPVSCFGGSNGTATVVAGGGTPGYTYAWAPSGGTNATASALSQGTYTVTITDANGCTRTATTTVTQPTLLTVSTVSTNSTCGLANGSATATASGGTTTYSYAWSPSGGSAAAATGLAASGYTVTVTDANGCTATSSTTVNDLSGLTASITAQTNVSCNGGTNGSVTVTASGSTGPYTYSINGGTTFQATGTFGTLAAGAYSVIARDANGCTFPVSVTIIEPSALTGAITAQVNVLCNGANTGSVTVAGNNGTSPYTYAINGVTFVASGTFAPLTAGSYTVTVRDANLCTITVPVVITQPTLLTASITSQTNNICFGGNAGAVTVSATGGTTAYTYALGAGAPQASGTFNALTAGSYTVNVTDGNGCTTTVPVTITEPTLVTVTATKVDATCGAPNGSLTATGSNGTPTYTYSINGITFQAGTTFTGLASGTYTVTVKDANGCTNTNTIAIVDLSGLTASITAQTNVSCNGGSNGTVTVTATGSTAPYSYSINGGALQSSGTFATLTQGTYTVTAQDANGCTVTVPVTITQPLVLTGAITAQTNVNCFGSSNGSVTVAATGGTSPYTYSINGGAAGASATFGSLAAATYTVTIADANSCTATVSVIITQPTALTLVTSAVPAICSASNGSASVVASGATPNYAYLWSGGGQQTATASNLPAGNYTVQVIDANGCQQTALVNVAANPGGAATIASITNVSCANANDGSITVSMGAGSTPPFTYAWNPSSQTGQTASGLAPASYTVTVTDGNGCIATANAVITQPAIITQTFGMTPVSCFGGSDGTITVTPNGGTAGYSYIWVPSGQTSQTATSLVAGTYTVTITDANGCTKTASSTVTEPTGMSLSETHVDANCNLSNGSATVTIAGGTGPYTYSWNTIPTQTTASVTGLAANTYACTVTDANGCSQIITVTIANLSGPVATVFSTINVSCNGGNNGAITVTTNGGTAPYTYSWNNGQTLPTATNLTAGTYTVNATDMNGCVASISGTVTEPLLFDINILGTDPSCSGSCNGSIISVANGGTAPYTYLWSPGGVTTQNVNNLCAGAYTLLATDANGCTSTKTLVLTNPAPVIASTYVTNVTCSGLCNGTAAVTTTSGNAPFAFAWSDPNSQATQLASGLCGGTYTVTVTDVTGCTTTATANVSVPNSLAVSITASGNVSCFGACDGFAQASVNGGSAPYSYMWMPTGTAGSNVNNLCAATYTVTVTDANGCSASTPVVITQPNPLVATITNTDVTCFGACDAEATAVYTGGTGPYTFLWTPGLQTTPTILNVCAGVNSLTVTDSHGCSVLTSTVVTEPTILAVTAVTSNSNCGNADGSACAQITGGVPPFIYSWNDPSTQAVACATGLNAGVYTISVTDNNGCSVVGVANVNDNTAPVVTIPTSTDVTCGGAANGSAQANIVGGFPPYITTWTPSAQTNTFANNLTGGTYSFVVTDASGCVGSASVIINEPTPVISAITGVTNVDCRLACNGTATVLAGGGTAPYNYLWNDVTTQTTATAIGLCAGSYTVTVTDANGCTSTSVATITEPTQLAISLLSSTNVSCQAGNNGAISITATGGTPGYTYQWTPNAGSAPQITNLVAGSYQVIVTDVNGCSRTTTIDITEPAALSGTPNANPTTCGNSNGSAGISMVGGVAPYAYVWTPSNGQTTAIITGVTAGTYSVVVTDANGCVYNSSSTVPNIAGPTIGQITFTPPLCSGQNNATATVIPNGGTPAYSYQWTGVGAQTTQTATALGSGTYSVTVRDANQCTASGSVTITEPAPTQIIVSPIDTICIGQLTQIYGAGYGGTPGYTYTWTPAGTFVGAGPHTVNPVNTTTYSVFATDANNCISPPQTITVFVNPPVVVTATDGVICDGSSITISASATGGNGGPYTYTWSNGANGASQTVSPTAPLSPMNYIVTANDNCSPTDTDTSTVIIHPQAVSFITVNDTAGCEDFTPTFTALSNIGVSYEWTFGDGSVAQTGSPIAHTYTTPGTYDITLSVTTAQGCTSTISSNQFIDVYPAPTAAFTSSPNPATSTAPLVLFQDQSVGAIFWAWDFGVPFVTSDSSSSQNPAYSYADTGIYVVQLIVSNSFGCTDTAYNDVEIQPEYVIYAPNAFTPLNHDGINDYFMPQGVGIDPNNFEMTIFDRWGNAIFKTTDINKGWDGKANGGDKVAQIDVYVWKIRTKDYRGDNHDYIGHVTIIK